MSLRARIIKALPRLTAAEVRVAEGILADPSAFVGRDAAQIAQATGTSTSTVSRFSRSVGSGAFAAFRVELAAEEARRSAQAQPRHGGEILGDITLDDDAEQVFAKLAAADLRAVSRVVDTVDYAGVAVIAERLKRTGRVLVFGVGSSSPVATDLAFKLNVAGVTATAAFDVHAALMICASLTEADAVILVSQSGRTHGTIQIAESARDAGAAVIAATGAHESPLIDIAAYSVVTGVGEAPVRSGGTATRLGLLVVVDLLFGLLMHAKGLAGADATRRMHEAVDLNESGGTAHSAP